MINMLIRSEDFGPQTIRQETKRSEGIDVRRPNVWRYNGQRLASVGQKRRERQNDWKDKTSGGTKRPEGRHVRRDETSVETKRSRGTKHPKTKYLFDLFLIYNAF
jgi:hypothetical protein